MSKNKNKNKNRNKNIDDKGKNFRTKPLIIGISTLILLSSIIAGLILLTGTQDTQAEIPTPNLGDLELEDSETKEEQTEETEPEKKTSIVTSGGSSNRPPPPPPLYTFKETIINEIRSKNVILPGEDGLEYYLGSNDDLTLPNGSKIFGDCFTSAISDPSFGSEKSYRALLSCVETGLNPFLDFITNTTSFFEETIPEMRSKENFNEIRTYLYGLPLNSDFRTVVLDIGRTAGQQVGVCQKVENDRKDYEAGSSSTEVTFDDVKSCFEKELLDDLIKEQQKVLGWCDGRSDENTCWVKAFDVVKSDLQRRDVLNGIEWSKVNYS